jgi:hypothetical protein
MHLVRDLLDNQLVDQSNRKAGKVDGIVIVLRKGKPPRVTAIEVGLPTILARIHPRLGAIGLWLERRLGIDRGRPVRIDIGRVTRAGINVKADIDANRTAAYAWERLVCEKFIEKIPWSGKGRPEGRGR